MKKKIITLCVLLSIAAICITGFTVKAYSTAEQNQAEASIRAGKGEKLIYGTVTSAIGNEIVCSGDSGEEESYQIPVGTSVVTRLGAVTTFSRITEGNEIAILMQENSGEILEVRITG